MKYYRIICNQDEYYIYKKPDYSGLLEKAERCEPFEIFDPRITRIIIDDAEYKLVNHYIYPELHKVLYVLSLA